VVTLTRTDNQSAGMVWIPGGEFTMGTDWDKLADESRPPGSREGFWMDGTEVTNARSARSSRRPAT